MPRDTDFAAPFRNIREVSRPARCVTGQDAANGLAQIFVDNSAARPSPTPGYTGDGCESPGLTVLAVCAGMNVCSARRDSSIRKPRACAWGFRYRLPAGVAIQDQ